MKTEDVSYYLGEPAAWIRVRGEDCDDFLQSQFSNDLRIDAGASAYGFWLDHRGRIHGDAQVLRIGPGDWRIASAGTSAEAILAKLGAFIVADDVELEDIGEGVSMLEISGEGVAPVLEAIGLPAVEPGRFRCTDGIYGWAGRASSPPSFTCLGPRGALQALAGRLSDQGACALDENGRARLRFAAAIPMVPAEAGPEDTPFDVGLEAFVSFNKGCFIGQEVVARLRNTGRAPRCLVRLRLDGPPPALPQPVAHDGLEVGQLRSALQLADGGWAGFAVVKRKSVEGLDVVEAP